MSGLSEQDLLGIVGDRAEYGSRVYVMPSYYGCEIGVADFGVSEPREDGTGGGSVFVELVAGVIDEGPYDGADLSARLWLSPGKTGGNLGFAAHTCKAITGQPVDMSAIAKYGLTPQSPGKEGQQELADAYFALDFEKRLAFWRDFARVLAWNGKKAVVKVGYEYDTDADGNRKTDDGGNVYPPRLRWQGFHAINDAKNGIAWVKKIHHPKQKIALESGYDPRNDGSIG